MAHYEHERNELRVLNKMVRMLRNPNRWVQGYPARDRRGNRCAVHSDRAYRFCLEALRRRMAGRHDRYQLGLRRLIDAIRASDKRYRKFGISAAVVISFNEASDRTISEVRAVVMDARDALRQWLKAA